ncbi:hypothetical protein BGLA2_260063 [Burkholderia gladioli]|nr:hypothetical protein BGLA2_260063 [Burkholderia gladioli]
MLASLNDKGGNARMAWLSHRPAAGAARVDPERFSQPGRPRSGKTPRQPAPRDGAESARPGQCAAPHTVFPAMNALHHRCQDGEPSRHRHAGPHTSQHRHGCVATAFEYSCYG